MSIRGEVSLHSGLSVFTDLDSVALGDHYFAATNEKEGELHQWWPRALIFVSH